MSLRTCTQGFTPPLDQFLNEGLTGVHALAIRGCAPLVQVQNIPLSIILTLPLVQICALCKVTLLLMRNSQYIDQGIIRDLIILRIQIARLRSSILTPLCIFIARLVLLNQGDDMA